MPKFSFLVFLFLIFSSLLLGVGNVRGDELDDLNKQIADLTKALNDSKSATTPLEQQVASIKSRVAFIESDVVKKGNDIDKGYKDLEKQTNKLNLAIRNYYIKSNPPFFICQIF